MISPIEEAKYIDVVNKEVVVKVGREFIVNYKNSNFAEKEYSFSSSTKPPVCFYTTI